MLEPDAHDRSGRLVTTPLVEAYKAYRLEVADADETTMNHELKALRMFGRWMRRRIGIPDNPFEDVRDVKDEAPSAGRCLAVDEYRRLAHAAEPDLQRWLLFAGLHGLRREEANHLRPDDLHLDEGCLDICKHRSPDGKLLWSPGVPLLICSQSLGQAMQTRR